MSISEVTGMQSDVVMMHEIFDFVQTGVDENRVAVGHFRATGMCPECLQKLNISGVNLPLEMFLSRRLSA